ncbi:MAG: ribonuclease HII [Rubrobacteraceae bacterium]|nr:ribonuclease HII [Rubrobacter sp.]
MARSRRKEPPGRALYAFDAAWVNNRGGPLVGADEAGRGSLAGPLVAAAAILDGTVIPDLDDSKTLSPATRKRLLEEVLGGAEAVSVVALPAWWIDLHGLGAANKEVLTRAIEMLKPRAGCALADGNLKLGAEVECQPRADGSSAAVAAASVVAKVLRDHAMCVLSGEHSGYGFERNSGYGTPQHRRALAEAGPCRVHRMSYAGVSR